MIKENEMPSQIVILVPLTEEEVSALAKRVLERK